MARSQWLLGLGAAAVLLVALAMYLTLSGQKAGLGPASEQSRVAKPQATASSPPAPQSLEQSANPPFATNESPHPAQVAGSVPPPPALQPAVDRPFQQAKTDAAAQNTPHALEGADPTSRTTPSISASVAISTSYLAPDMTIRQGPTIRFIDGPAQAAAITEARAGAARGEVLPMIPRRIERSSTARHHTAREGTPSAGVKE